LEETNYNLQQQNLNLDANLQNSKLAHQEVLQLLHERDDQDVSFASADLTSDQEEQQTHQENQHNNPSPRPHISNYFVQQDPNAVAGDEMAGDAVENLITALNRRENVQAITNYSGNGTDQYITSWLTEAEAIATIHNWDDAAKKTNFASRLKGPALIWHSERSRSNPNDTYTQWKHALKTHFKHPADRDKQLNKLENLTQKPNQPVRMFIEKINRSYNALYDDRNNQDLKLKNDTLVKILLKGVIKPIKTLMVLNQLLPEVTTWQEAQDAAIRCETTLYKTQSSNGILELPTFASATVDDLRTTVMQQQQKEIEMLRAQLSNKVNFLGDAQKPDDQTVNYVGQQERGRPQQRRYNTYKDQNNSTVKWSDNAHSSQHYQQPNQRPRSQSRDYNQRSHSRDSYQKQNSGQQNQYQNNHQYQYNHQYQSNQQYQNNPQYQNTYQNTQQYQQQQPNKSYQNQSDQKYKSPSRRPGTPGPPSRSNSKNRDLSQIDCHRCGNFGHLARECKTKNPARFRQQEK
jgi:hypothetical protein